MIPRKKLPASLAAIAVAVVSVAAPAPLSAQQRDAIRIGDADLGGVVSGAQGPEAGVWVIAETTDLPTKFAKIVVTDDQGRYVMPDLPKANYNVWVRGYGLVDSPKVQAAPGKMLDLTAVAGPECHGGGAVLPGDLLVFDAQGPWRKLRFRGSNETRACRPISPRKRSGSTSSRPPAACPVTRSERSGPAPSPRSSANSAPPRRPGSAASSPGRL